MSDHLHYKHEYKELVEYFELLFNRSPTEYETGILAGICAYKENMAGIIDGKKAMNIMSMLKSAIDYRKNKEIGIVIHMPSPPGNIEISKSCYTVKNKTADKAQVISFSEFLNKILGWTE